MTQRASDSLIAVLIRIGLLLALGVLLMAENAQAKPLTTSFHPHRTGTGSPTSRPRPDHAAGTRMDRNT